MFLTFSKNDAENSEDARDLATDFLNFNGFVGNDKKYSSGVADWFVIGGRWSGELTRIHLDKEKLKACNKEFEEKYGWFLGGENGVTETQRRKEYQEVFKKYFPDFRGMIAKFRISSKKLLGFLRKFSQFYFRERLDLLWSLYPPCDSPAPGDPADPALGFFYMPQPAQRDIHPGNG